MQKNKITVMTARRSWPAKARSRSPRTASRSPTSRPSTSSSPPARGARSLPGLEPDGKLVWTYKEAMVPAAMPKSLLVVGSRRDRHRIRQLLPRHGRRGDGGRGARPRAPGRGRGNLRLRPQGFRKAGHEDPHRRHGEGAEEGQGQCHRADRGRRQGVRPHRRPRDPRGRHRRQCRGYRPRRHQGQGRPGPCRRRRVAAAPASPASMRSAIWSARPGWRTRRCTRA